MKKQEILNYIDSNIERITNNTRKNNIKALKNLVNKYLNSNQDYNRVNNIGDIAEKVVIEYLQATPTSNNFHGDAILKNNEIVEIKCCLNGDSHRVYNSDLDVYVMAKNGLYFIPKKQVKNLVGKRLTNSDLKTMQPIKTFKDLLK